MIQFGIRRIDVGILKTMKPKDELVTALNAIAAFIGLAKDSDRFVSAVLAVLHGEGIDLVWDEKEKKFRRVI